MALPLVSGLRFLFGWFNNLGLELSVWGSGLGLMVMHAGGLGFRGWVLVKV